MAGQTKATSRYNQIRSRRIYLDFRIKELKDDMLKLREERARIADELATVRPGKSVKRRAAPAMDELPLETRAR